ncbi:MAG TPA: glycerophosphodiester phosphodiesterase family protein [Gemmataceae bacterium]|nr:glycerophosphodiester phosphodiesterase family protein [Gemmataceae bacterium]
MTSFELQGHRGARGLRPENTLPAFEVAFDLGVSSIETDVHLTNDGVPVLIHDARIHSGLCRLRLGGTAPDPAHQPAVRSLSLAELRDYRADRNPDPGRFPRQVATPTPLAQLFAERADIDPYGVPTLAELFAFAQAYAGQLGAQAGKTDRQRQKANRLWFDLELKRMPFHADRIGNDFQGDAPALLEAQAVRVVRDAGFVRRTRVRSFDHRSVRAVHQLEPGLVTAVLIAETAPVNPSELVRQAEARIYCPDYRFLDLIQIRQLHAEGIPVIPWTVNESADWLQLLDWGVDGITTDYPGELAAVLKERGIDF